MKILHEAQQARVPVITADTGDMAEYVRHEVNGLLFEHRSHRSLACRMQRLVDDPGLARRLGRRSYLDEDAKDDLAPSGTALRSTPNVSTRSSNSTRRA